MIDANWYVSACINRTSRRTLYYKILKNKQFQVFYSKELLEEFEGVITRSKFQKLISRHQFFRF
ncbi:MAG: hypothetical protein LRY55_09480, partial [Leadbetterella sp.]|nr:hypothetical protein [Leadbetterella sp.]